MTNTVRYIAHAFASAREFGRTLDEFPLKVPASLQEAYLIQDEQVVSGKSVLQGWKVAAIRPEWRDRLGAQRLAGPILQLIDARDASECAVSVPIIAGGFAAVEAEFAYKIRCDIPLRDDEYSAEELLDSIASMHIAVEVAGSPLALLSELGPLAVVSDHGNNLAVLVGPSISDWRDRSLDQFNSRTTVNGVVVGEGGASRLPSGGPLGSLDFLVKHLAQRGRFLMAGQWVATGATTGVHPVVAGDAAILDFGGDGQMSVTLVEASTRV